MYIYIHIYIYICIYLKFQKEKGVRFLHRNFSKKIFLTGQTFNVSSGSKVI